jgi:hypothetical protein
MAETIKNHFGQSATGDGSMMCGPLAWTITNDANSFPYRIGYWFENPQTFIGANPRSNGHPWAYFDPESFDMLHETSSMNGYDFVNLGNWYPGDILYSFTALTRPQGVETQNFDHIFIVTGIGANNERFSVSNLVRNYPYKDCTIEEIALYTPGDRTRGFVNWEWNKNGFGETGYSGFDRLRWKWSTYHLEGKERDYVIRIGDTLETIGFDWKIDPSKVAERNGISMGSQLSYGQTIVLPATN